MRAYITHQGRPGVSFGCLGSIAVAIGYLAVVSFFVFLVVATVGVFAATLLVVMREAMDETVGREHGKLRRGTRRGIHSLRYG